MTTDAVYYLMLFALIIKEPNEAAFYLTQQLSYADRRFSLSYRLICKTVGPEARDISDTLLQNYTVIIKPSEKRQAGFLAMHNWKKYWNKCFVFFIFLFFKLVITGHLVHYCSNPQKSEHRIPIYQYSKDVQAAAFWALYTESYQGWGFSNTSIQRVRGPRVLKAVVIIHGENFALFIQTRARARYSCT